MIFLAKEQPIVTTAYRIVIDLPDLEQSNYYSHDLPKIKSVFALFIEDLCLYFTQLQN
ncbi:hypothetical protein [Acinetobacter sp. YH16049]|uniref:hypothetical protein n=1 Tax=Acinetobacter sp. YH16049 TaxID=2601188 RepID=UPI0015D12BBA|nr:hypothetical protein [Acinetobacter sp. YH16049]UNW06842.1 hypothetical protein MOV98_16050 [Acinetobacter variabilis]